MYAGRAAEFDREIEHVPAAQRPAAPVRRPGGADKEDEAPFERLASGEDICARPELGLQQYSLRHGWREVEEPAPTGRVLRGSSYCRDVAEAGLAA